MEEKDLILDEELEALDRELREAQAMFDPENHVPAISGTALMDLDFPPTEQIVKGLITKGLSILSGAPKVGKSWLAMDLCLHVAKGEPFWGMEVSQGTAWYLSLEDTNERAQRRLACLAAEEGLDNIYITTKEHKPGTMADGLPNTIDKFMRKHPDTKLIVIDTMQMAKGTSKDATYNSDYTDAGAFKDIADKHKVALLLIHHLRKETADDVFSRISGTTAISGAVDSSFTLVESKRGSGQAMLYCIGRDIEYREIELKRGEENIWEVVSDSRVQPLMLESRVVFLLSEFMKQRTEFIGTPTELSQQIDPAGVEQITPKKVSRLVLQSVDALSKTGISASVRRSNGKRLIELRRADSVDIPGAGESGTCDPAGATGGDLCALSGEVE